MFLSQPRVRRASYIATLKTSARQSLIYYSVYWERASSDRWIGAGAGEKSARSSYMLVADVDGLVDDDPRDRLLATRLRQRTVIRDVIISGWQEAAD